MNGSRKRGEKVLNALRVINNVEAPAIDELRQPDSTIEMSTLNQFYEKSNHEQDAESQ